jgi:hypothetical protein
MQIYADPRQAETEGIRVVVISIARGDKEELDINVRGTSIHHSPRISSGV